MKLWQWLIDFFGFSKKEANGILILFVMIIALAIYPRMITYETNNTFTEDSLLLNQWYQSLTLENGHLEKPEEERPLVQLSQSPKKPWKEKESKKPSRSVLDQPKAISSTSPENVKVNLNTVTSEQLMEVRGIGAVLSERIIKFRNQLGGFHDLNQLQEVYGLKPEVIERLKQAYEIGTLNQLTIPINSDSLKHLFRHPYVDYKTAQRIFNYRITHGNYTSPEQLKEIKVISDSLYQKIYPYISLESSSRI